MGVYIKPCHGCPLGKECDLRADYRNRVANLGLRSATFDCPRLAAELRLGRRIEISTVVGIGVDQYGEEYGAIRSCVPATITSVYRTSFACVIDKGAISESPDDHADGLRNIAAVRFRRYQPHTRILRFLDEPDAPSCANGRIMRDGICDRSSDDACYCKEQEGWR